MTEQINKQPSQAYIFFGEDDFSLRRKIDTWKREFAKKYSNDSVVVLERGDKPEQELVGMLDQALSPSLFSTRKLVVAKDFLPSKAAELKLGETILNKLESLPSDYFLIFWQTSKPDKRLGLIKKIIAAKINLSEFELPHGNMLNAWIKAYAKTIGLTMDEEAIEELSKFIGRDLFEEKKAGGKVIERKEAYDLWQVHSELEKISSYTKHADINAIRILVKPKVSENIFALTDELGKKNKRGALQVIENLFMQSLADEKTTIIKMLALLAEQVRGMLVVKVLQDEGRSSADIAESLGWSSGRVFITAKNSAQQTLDNLKKMLAMLTELDTKIKSTDDNAKLLLNQFVIASCS